MLAIAVTKTARLIKCKAAIEEMATLSKIVANNMA